jgi:hypothetical protein
MKLLLFLRIWCEIWVCNRCMNIRGYKDLANFLGESFGHIYLMTLPGLLSMCWAALHSGAVERFLEGVKPKAMESVRFH